MLRNALLICCLLLLAGAACANPFSQVRVQLPDRASAQLFAEQGFDISHRFDRSATIVAESTDLARLDALGLSYTVEITDMQGFYAERLEADSELDDMGGYPLLSEIYAWVDSITAARPDLVAGPDTIGFSVEGRPLRVLKLSDNPASDEDEAEIFINSAIHAREVITPMILMNFAELLLNNPDGDGRIDDILANCEIWLLPVTNPDGYYRNGQLWPDGGGMHRKNTFRVPNHDYGADSTGIGVDLNRNWGYMWGLDDQGSSPDPDGATYRGSAGFDQPETAALRDFVSARQFSSVLNYHSYSDLLLYPWGYTAEPHPTADVHEVYANEVTSTLDYTVSTGYGLYPTNGSADDWLAAGAVGDGPGYELYSFTFEVGSYQDGFWPSLSRQPVLIAEHEEPMLRFCELAWFPAALLGPEPPTVIAPDTAAPGFTLSWSPAPDTTENAPTSFRVADLRGESGVADAEVGYFGIARDGFILSGNDPFSGLASYHSGSGDNLSNSLTTTIPLPVTAGDSLIFQARWEIEQAYDWAYVQSSFDGGPWQILEGNITTTDDPNNVALGPGITGNSDGWVRAAFALPDSAAGRTARFRWSYITDGYVDEAGLFLDEIEPFQGYANQTLFAVTSDTSTTVDHLLLEEPTLIAFVVRGVDANGDLGEWSDPARVWIDPDLVDAPAATRPLAFELSPARPNPFNPTATLQLTLPRTADVQLTVYDLLGREVMQRDLAAMNPGEHAIALDGTRWASGIYFVRLTALDDGGTQRTALRKAVLLK